MASTLSNLLWKSAERLSSQLVSFAVSIVLARILLPSDYGMVSMVMIFVTLANVFVESGFSSALIQKKDADILDFSSVFYFSIFVSVILYAILYITAPYVALFYGKEYAILAPVLRVIGIQIIIYGVNSVQQAYVTKHMMFRKFFWSTLSGTIVSACIGLTMAYLGYGIWALVGQQLSMSLMNTLVLFLVTRKLPGLIFSFNRLRGLFTYGVKIFGASLLTTLFLDLRSLIIGKIYSPKDLAFFDRGRQFPNLIVANISSSVGAVLFPKMSQEQDDKEQVKQICRNSIRFGSFIMMPMMMGLAVCAEPFVRLLLTDKWIQCVPFLQLFCIIYMFYPMHTANMQAIKALGYSGTYLKLELIKKIIELIGLLIVMRISVSAIAINMAILTALFTFLNAYPNIKLIGYSFKEQMADILPSFAISFIMAILVYIIGILLPIKDIYLLMVQIISGVLIYIILSYILHDTELKYIYTLLLKKKQHVSK